MFDTKHITIKDPREFDGTPFEVAERAVKQAQALAAMLNQAVDAAERMARNAEMERDLYATGTCDATAWPGTPQGVRWDAVKTNVLSTEKMLGVLAAAAAFNPRNRTTK